MEYLPLPLGQQFNTLYTEVLNCDIVPPPFYTGRIPDRFFLKKRGSFSAVTSAQVYDIIYDIYEDGTDTYYIGKISTNIVVKKNSITLHTSTYVAGVQYKFFMAQGAKGTLFESGINGEGKTAGVDIVIEDITKTWAVDAYVGKYVYVYEASAGEGQVFKVDSNSATQLFITTSGYKSLPAAGSKYKIFDSYGFVLSFVAGGYIYNIQNDTTVLPIHSVPSPIDAVFFNSTYYIVDTNKNIHVGDRGIFAGYFGTTELIGSSSDVVNIINFKDYILLVGNKGISTIRTISRTDEWNVTVFDYTIIPVTTEVGIFQQGTYIIHNTGFYLISQNKKFLGIDITDVGVDKFTVTSNNQGTYIQQFLDTLTNSSLIKVGINDTNIYIIVAESGVSYIYNYDIMYMGWHKWKTLLPLNNFKLNKFIGDTLYTKGYDAGIDDGGLTYNQQLRIVLGEDTVYLMKRAILTKLYIGKNTTKNTYIQYTAMAGGNVDKYVKKLEESGYIQDLLGYGLQTDGTLGTTLLGLSLLGDSLTNGLDLVADFGLIENPTGFFYEICILDIIGNDSDEFEIGGMIFGYTKFEPSVTSYRNVI